jgi:hypothetical protein
MRDGFTDHAKDAAVQGPLILSTAL